MKLIEVFALVTVFLICTLGYLIVSYLSTSFEEDGVIIVDPAEFAETLNENKRWEDDATPEIILVLVICGNNTERITQAATTLKSAILPGNHMQLRIIIFVDNEARPLFTKQVKSLLLLGEMLESRISVELKSTWFPKNTFTEWNQLYTLCATQRLFFPSLLPTTDAVIYLDTDILVLDNLGNLWNKFNLMNEHQFVGVSPENELPGKGWYDTNADFPYYGPRGVNNGVMLMNLTRMRAAEFERHAHNIYKEYREKLYWGDQDILNIFLHSHPEHVYLLSCAWNYRMDHCDCQYSSGGSCACKDAENKGASLFHGNKEIFLSSSKYSFAQNFYTAFTKNELLQGPPKDLINELSNSLKSQIGATATCKRLKGILLRKIRERYEDNDNEPFLDFSSGSN